MPHPMFNNEYGFPFAQTELNGEVLVGQEVAHDSIAWLDLDGDEHIDLVAITVNTGETEDSDHELVALHVPSGKAFWRVRNGDVSQKIAVADGVLVASTDNSRYLRGLDLRNGQDLWELELPDALENDDAYDGDDAASALTARGAWVIFQCVDESSHVVEARTGKLVKSFEDTRLEHHWLDIPGLACFHAEDGKFIAWDIARERPLLETENAVAPAIGDGMFALLEDESDHTTIRIYDSATLQQKQVVQAATPEGRALPQGYQEYGRQKAMLLPGNRLVTGREQVAMVELGGEAPASTPEDPEPAEAPKQKGFFARLFGGGDSGGDTARGSAGPAGKKGNVLTATMLPPPKEGYEFCGFARTAGVLAAAYRKEKGTEKLIVVGYDEATMQQRWVVENAGGRAVEVSLLATGNAFLVPHSPRPEDHHYHEGNKQAWWHINPADGARVTEYPVAEIQCVEAHGKYFCAFAATYGSCLPVAYDTERMERVL